MPPALRRIISWFMLAFAVLGIYSLSIKEYRLALVGVRGTGVVDKVEVITTSTTSTINANSSNPNKRRVRHGSQSTILHMTVTTQEGKTSQIKTHATFNTEAKVGDRFEMIYLPSKPDVAKIYNARQFWLPMMIGTIVTAFCLVVGLLFVRP